MLSLIIPNIHLQYFTLSLVFDGRKKLHPTTDHIRLNLDLIYINNLHNILPRLEF